MRLLVAEDEKRLNKIICEALEDEGYSVDACFDGEQALEYARDSGVLYKSGRLSGGGPG